MSVFDLTYDEDTTRIELNRQLLEAKAPYEIKGVCKKVKAFLRMHSNDLRLFARPVVIEPIYDNGEGSEIEAYELSCPACRFVFNCFFDCAYCPTCGQCLDWIGWSGNQDPAPEE